MPAEHVTGISLPQRQRGDWHSNYGVILAVHASPIPLVLTGKKYRDTTFQMNTAGRFRVFMSGREPAVSCQPAPTLEATFPSGDGPCCCNGIAEMLLSGGLLSFSSEISNDSLLVMRFLALARADVCNQPEAVVASGVTTGINWPRWRPRAKPLTKPGDLVAETRTMLSREPEADQAPRRGENLFSELVRRSQVVNGWDLSGIPGDTLALREAYV
jgi:hypothetical protein